jgi:hypothetical protein
LSVIAILGFISYLLATLGAPGLPWRTVLGIEPRTAFLSRLLPEYAVVQLLEAEPGTKRAASNYDGVPQIYTEIALNPILYPREGGMADVLRDEHVLLAYLDHERYSHLIVNHGIPINWWAQNVSGDDDFLRRNTMLVGGGNNTYLYRLLPPELRGTSETWAHGPELLPNTDFEASADGKPVNWEPLGSSTLYDERGTGSRSGRGAVRVQAPAAYGATVGVTPNTQYLLSYFARAESGLGWASANVIWSDAAGKTIVRYSERAPVSDAGYREWWLLATAPPNAVKAAVYLSSAHTGDIWFDDVSLRARDVP